MDLKTLEYMKTRVDKASDLAKRIDVVSKTIDLINESEVLYELELNTPDGSRDLIRRYAGQDNLIKQDDLSREELYRIIKPVLLNAFLDKRKKLQKELDEI